MTEFAGNSPGSMVSMEDKVDLTNCDREPIHIPGSIQPHGVLFFLTEPELVIRQASANTQEVLGIAADDCLDQQLETVLEPEQVADLRARLALEEPGMLNPLLLTEHCSGGMRHFDGIVHRSNGGLILELEPIDTHEALTLPGFYHIMRSSATVLQGAADLRSLSQAAAEMVQRITGFDRVMIYRFHPDWHGEVIAEAKRQDLEPYLGLHYPASDIPQQARELYRRNWLRLIADVAYRPTPLVPQENPLTGNPLNLGASVLRSVSPMHIAYLKNMGVASSMSVSILKNEQLWGLISCHHGEAKYVPYTVRAACEFLGQLLSLQIAAQENVDTYAAEVHAKDVQSRLLEDLLQHDQVLDGLLQDQAQLLELVCAQGAALYVSGQYIPLGVAPDEEVGLRIIDWLRDSMHGEQLFATDALSSEWQEAEAWKDQVSGLLAIAITEAQEEDYVLWFRPEVVSVVQWGGDPNKPVEVTGGTMTLHPRTSFAAWSQTVRLKAVPWQAYELEAARVLRSTLLDRILRGVIVRKSNELALLNTQLEQSNNELDAFAYIVSHDLKEPLRGINNYVHILKEDYAARLDEDGLGRLDTLLTLTQRLDALIDALLHYSRVGRVDLAFAETNLNDVVARVLEVLHLRLEQAGVEVRIPRPLPALWCDRVRVGEIYSNLITNAIKYNDKGQKWIEIGYLDAEDVSEGAAEAPVTLYVRDNGIGIRDKHFAAIFRMFRRLHGRDKFGGGSGAGLTIARRIVERHNGTMWVESTYGEGTTFFFTLSKGRQS